MTQTNPRSNLSRASSTRFSSGLILLGATLILGACGGDSSAGPRDEDNETAESRLMRPGTVGNLSVESTGARTVTLSFTEVSDGLSLSRPASYEVRYRATPMRNNWNSATVVRNGTCAAPVTGTQVGRSRSCTVEGLSPSSSYDFQLVAFRRQGNTTTYGQLSNVTTGVTRAAGSTVSEVFLMAGDGQTGVVGTALPQQLAVKVKDQAGNGLQGISVSWSANGGGGSVSASTTTTDSEGYARVTRTLGTVRGVNRTTAYVNGASPVEFRATAEAGPVASVAVLPGEVSMNVGDSTAMVAILEDQYGNRITGRTVTWSSSDAGIASVRSNGTVNARKRGVASVTASVDGASGAPSGPQAAPEGGSTVRVMDESSSTPGSVVALAGSGQSATVGTQLSQTLVAEVRSTSGDLMSGITVNWQVVDGGGSLASSSSVTNSNGRATNTLTLGTVAGTNQVRATVTGVSPATFTAQGQPGALASVTVTPGSSSVNVGGTVQFSAALRDQHGNALPGTPTWSSTSNSVATVNASGLATAVAGGSANIRATFGGMVGQAALTVNSVAQANPGTVNNLAVTGTTATSATLRFTSVTDGSGSPANYEVRYAATPLGWGWGSATPVSQGTCSGVVTSSSIGQQVTCTVAGLPSGASLDFQVVAYRGNLNQSAVFGSLSNIATGQTGASAPIESGTLSISPRGGTLTAIGATLQLSVTARSGSGATISNPGAAWTSSNTNVATVDASGRVTARGLGSAIISVAAACCTGDQVQVTVTQQIASVSVSPSSNFINVGATRQLEAVAQDSNGNVIPNVMFAWSSNNSGVASVNGSGLVTGAGQGNANVTASAGGRSAAATFTVSQPASGGTGGGGGGSSSAWPNRPSGWRTLSGSTDFRNGSNGGWGVKFADGSRPAPRTVAISDSPVGSTHEYRFDYPAGHSGGGGPEAYMNISGNPQSVYVGMWIRYSQNWQGHPSCINKYLYLATTQASNAWSAVWYEACGSGGSTLHSYQVNQTSGCGGAWRNESVLFERGRWHRVEVIQTVGNPGRVRVWVDGRLTTDVSACVSGSGMREATLSGIWGGVGGSVNSSMFWGVAAVEIAAP